MIQNKKFQKWQTDPNELTRKLLKNVQRTAAAEVR